MNFSAKLKSSNHPPNYIFNFNIDIPLKYKSTYRSNQTSPTKSPGKLNNKKCKLSSITPRPTKITPKPTNSITPRHNHNNLLLENNNIKKSGNKSKNNTNSKSHNNSSTINNKIPKTMKQEFLEKDMYQINNFNFYQQLDKDKLQKFNFVERDKKSLTPSISRKTQRIVHHKKNQNQQEICPSRKTVKNNQISNQSKMTDEQNSRQNLIRNISILEKLITDQHNIKYTTDASELKITEPSLPINFNNSNINTISYHQQFNLNCEKNQKITIQQLSLKSMNRVLNKTTRVPTIYDQEVNLNEIRQYEQISTQRKQRLNYEYLKEKILVQSSVKKIQRAWRNYQTKKLVNSYSTSLKMKLLKNQNIINSSRSQSKGLNIFRKPLNNQHKMKTISQINNSHKQTLSNYVKYEDKFNENQRCEISNSEDDFPETPEQIKRQRMLKPFSKKNKPSKVKLNEINHTAFFDTPQSQRKKKIVYKQKRIDPQYQEQMKVFKQAKDKQIEEKLKKFQEEQIKKWELILESIKKGSNIESLLQKSQKFKKELENNLKILNVKFDKNRASPILFKTNSSKTSLSCLGNTEQITLSLKNNQVNTKLSQNSFLNKQEHQLLQYQPSSSSELTKGKNEISQQMFTPTNIKTQLEMQIRLNELNVTEEKRKQQIMFFENQILKIDNEDYSDISNSMNSEGDFNYHLLQHENEQIIDFRMNMNQKIKKRERNAEYQELEERQRQENIKLRKKLELFNTHFLDFSSPDEGITDRSFKFIKGQSSDERRNITNQKLIKQANYQYTNQDIPRNGEKQLLSQENRRPDIQLAENNNGLLSSQIQKERSLSKITQLINKKIEYPESDEESSLEVEPQEVSKSSIYENEIVDCDDDQHFLEPVLTHRQRKFQVPELNLKNISLKNKQNSVIIPEIKTIENKKNQTSENQIEEEIKKKKVDQFLTNFQLLDIKIEKKGQKIKKIHQVQMKEALKICSMFEEQLMYEVLLEFSDSEKIVRKIKTLFENFRNQQKKTKPEGICTNLQSIKDYLQNFVGFIYENNLTNQIQDHLWTPNGPTVQELLKYLRKDVQFDNAQNQYIMSINIFQKHWKYANSNIYFDRKYSDEKTQNERVNYLKGLTRVYFRAIFDAFNESLQFQRSFGPTGQSYPWSRKISRQNKKNLKSAFQQAYRRILKVSVVYCGVHFDQKAQLVNEESIKEIQEERLLTLLTMELQQDEYRWNFFQDQHAEVKYELSLYIEEFLLSELISQAQYLLQRHSE